MAMKSHNSILPVKKLHNCLVLIFITPTANFPMMHGSYEGSPSPHPRGL